MGDLRMLQSRVSPIPTPSVPRLALHSQPVSAAQSSTLRNPAYTPLKGREGGACCTLRLINTGGKL